METQSPPAAAALEKTPSKNPQDEEVKKENLQISAAKSESDVLSAKMETPEAVRMRRSQMAEMQKLHMSSPSDSMLSPCTSKLFGKDGRRKANSNPMAILRKKQQTAIPFNLNQE